MEQEYSHLQEIYGSKISLIFGDIHGYAEERDSCSYLDIIDDLKNLWGMIDPSL